MPDAPAPTYDGHGNMVAAWAITVEYCPIRDVLSVRWRQEAGPYHKAKRLATDYPVDDLETVIADIQRAIRIMGARRLF